MEKFDDCEFVTLKHNGVDLKTIACFKEQRCIVKPPDAQVAALKNDAGFAQLAGCA